MTRRKTEATVTGRCYNSSCDNYGVDTDVDGHINGNGDFEPDDPNCGYCDEPMEVDDDS